MGWLGVGRQVRIIAAITRARPFQVEHRARHTTGAPGKGSLTFQMAWDEMPNSVPLPARPVQNQILNMDALQLMTPHQVVLCQNTTQTLQQELHNNSTSPQETPQQHI